MSNNTSDKQKVENAQKSTIVCVEEAADLFSRLSTEMQDKIIDLIKSLLLKK